MKDEGSQAQQAEDGGRSHSCRPPHLDGVCRTGQGGVEISGEGAGEYLCNVSPSRGAG